jgi:hypothetical protein
MDYIKHESSDFFPAMILRELVLIFWRIIPIIFIILFIKWFWASKENLLSIILSFIIFGQILAFSFVYLFDKKENINK